MAVTFNPSDKSANITLSNGDLTATVGTNAWCSVRATLSKSSGKWYWETTIDVSNAHHCVGIATSDTPVSTMAGADVYSYGYYDSLGQTYHSNTAADYGAPFDAGAIIGIALDLDNGKIWWSKNGVWQASGDPGAGTNEAYSGLSGTFFPMYSLHTSPAAGTVNFGASAFTYTIPSGFSMLETTEKSISEGINVLSEFDDSFGELDETVSVRSRLIYLDPDSPISEDVSVNSNLIAGYTGELSEEASVNAGIDAEKYFAGNLSEEISVNSAFGVVRYLTIVDTLSSWDTIKWGWNKAITDSFDITEAVSKILGIPVKEWLSIKDVETNNWNGFESVSDSFYTVDISKAVKVYYDSVADGMAIADAVKLALRLIITDIFTCVDTLGSTWAGSRSVSSSFGVTDTASVIKFYEDLISDGMAVVDAATLVLELIIADKFKIVDSSQNIGVFQHPIEDGMTLEDIARRLFPKSVSDSFMVADTNLVDFFALLQIADSFNTADTASRLLTINQAIADSLEALDTITIQQLIQELIQEGLNFDVSVIIDNEVWETWVLNTSAFHPSIYSNYEFNSFAIDKSNNVCYGCKSDGIYKLEGDTDNGEAFHSGIILPATQFGSANQKSFRKAYFGVSGNDLVMKMETESGYRTFRMVDTEMSLTRDLKGRKWEITLENFDELDFIELVPVILSRK